MRKIDTKSLLAQSILELVQKKPVEKITVTDITNNCSLKRETFYYHFYDKYELIKWFYEKTAAEILEKYMGKEPWGVIFTRLLQIVQKNRKFYQSALTDQNINNLRSRMFEMWTRVMSTIVSDKMGKDPLPDDVVFYIALYVHGSISIFYDWLENGMKTNEREMGRLLEESMPPKLRVFFEEQNNLGKSEEPFIDL